MHEHTFERRACQAALGCDPIVALGDHLSACYARIRTRMSLLNVLTSNTSIQCCSASEIAGVWRAREL